MKIRESHFRIVIVIILVFTLFKAFGNASAHDHDDRYYTKTYVDALEKRIAALEAKLQNLSVVSGSINGMPGPHLIITGANLHVRNGSGKTESINGKGNLIVGYNELRGTNDNSTGSHNVVVGKEHNYSSHGGLVAGRKNTISGEFSCVSGGWENVASGDFSNVSGGYLNNAFSNY